MDGWMVRSSLGHLCIHIEEEEKKVEKWKEWHELVLFSEMGGVGLDWLQNLRGVFEGGVLDHLCLVVLGRLWVVLVGLWVVLGGLWVVLGRLWVVLGGLWVVLGGLWVVLGRLWVVLVGLWVVLVGFGLLSR
jgi:hypothetical protein